MQGVRSDQTKRKKSLRSMQGIWSDQTKQKKELAVNAGYLE
jgi:hypothetical protein